LVLLLYIYIYTYIYYIYVCSRTFATSVVIDFRVLARCLG